MLVYSGGLQQSSPPLRIITVTGKGALAVPPDYAELQIGVITDAMEVTKAQRENAVIMNRIIQSLLELGIAREDIQTEIYNVTPKYDYIEGKQVFRGYEVTNAITVKVKNLNDVGKVIDTAVKNGANQISQIQFKIENENFYYQQALRLALKNAQEKARTIAQSLKLSYMPIPIEIVEESIGGPILYKTVTMTQQSVETPIEQGVITISAEVRVKFQY